jgi:hypothetical protein
MRTYEQLPENIDLNTADDRTLRRFGLPRRPDPEKEPDLARLWHRAVTRLPHPKIINPELEPDAVRKRRLPKLQFGPNMQAGAIVPVEFQGPTAVANWVFGEWMIPQVIPAPGNSSELEIVSFWVGISGVGPSGGVSLLQAGVAAAVGVGTDAIYWPWVEWWTNEYMTPASKVKKFSVSQGDQISVLVCSPQPQIGVAVFVNYTTGEATTVGIPIPGSDITAQGSTAQWTVEQSGSVLPQFTLVEFTNCSGGGPNLGFDLSAPGAGAENIVDSNGNILAVGAVLSKTTASVLWQANM